MNAQNIVRALGGQWHGGYGMAFCPTHNDGRTPALKIRPDPRKSDDIDVHCFGPCDWRAVKLELSRRGLLDGNPPTQPAQPDRRLPKPPNETATRIWQGAGSAEGTVVERYLASRGILLPIPPSIRFAMLKHGPTGLQFPCLVAGVQQVDGAVVAISQTYLLPDGSGKARVSQSRMALGPISGNAVRLTVATEKVWLVEGIEDGLSVLQMTGRAAWAVLGTSGFVNVNLPPRITEVVLAPDADAAGDAIIEKAAKRLIEQGRIVKVARPKTGDWNDALQHYEERAGIVEHDGPETTELAEERARFEVFEL